MDKGFFAVPAAKNEPVRAYRPGSPERKAVQEKYDQMWANKIEIPMVINGKEVETGDLRRVLPPHDHQHDVGSFHFGTKEHVTQAIEAALSAKEEWELMSWTSRLGIFLRAADLVAGKYRDELNAATMIGQSKTVHQAEIDSACELADFLRFNVQYAAEIYNEQPYTGSGEGLWNRVEYRPLEGFTFAITPFNFTAIAGNLGSCMAMMGNVVVWKPSLSQIYSAHVIMKVFKEAGLPDGVINMIITDPQETSELVFRHPEFSGLHFTGSTEVFKNIWAEIGQNINNYHSYPRIVGETGGKDFVMVHKSAQAPQVATALTRGAFEFQGQKCSAASRAYVPDNLWPEVKNHLLKQISEIKMGSPRDFENFFTAVIHEGAFDKLAGYIDRAKQDDKAEVIAGGNYDKSKGWFVEPTVILTEDSQYVTMETELFGPVLTIYVYPAAQYEETLKLVDQTSPYALTGALFAQDRYALERGTIALRNCAGNFYLNDKPTGAVVGQQPFGGARGSGTNDKAGSKQNLYRWISPRLIKETFDAPTDFRYPFMDKE